MNGQGDIVEWNQEAEKTFGFSREEVLGKSLAETIVPLSIASRTRRD